MTEQRNIIDDDDTSVTVELDTLLEEVQNCLQKCRAYQKISGMSKLERKFRAEDRFLKRVYSFFSIL